jgi:hypothetical protein
MTQSYHGLRWIQKVSFRFGSDYKHFANISEIAVIRKLLSLYMAKPSFPGVKAI